MTKRDRDYIANSIIDAIMDHLDEIFAKPDEIDEKEVEYGYDFIPEKKEEEPYVQDLGSLEELINNKHTLEESETEESLLSNLAGLFTLLNHNEKKENYHECGIIKRKIDIVQEKLSKY